MVIMMVFVDGDHLNLFWNLLNLLSTEWLGRISWPFLYKQTNDGQFYVFYNKIICSGDSLSHKRIIRYKWIGKGSIWFQLHTNTGNRDDCCYVQQNLRRFVAWWVQYYIVLWDHTQDNKKAFSPEQFFFTTDEPRWTKQFSQKASLSSLTCV